MLAPSSASRQDAHTSGRRTGTVGKKIRLLSLWVQSAISELELASGSRGAVPAMGTKSHLG